MIANSEDAIVSVDAQGKIIFWNRAAETMFGYSAYEVVGKPAIELVPERFRENLRRIMSRSIPKGGLVTLGKAFEFHGLRKDDSEFPLELSVTMWETKYGVFIAAILRDISERKKVENALRRSEWNVRRVAVTFAQSHEEERQHIAMELHDRIAQTLTAVFHQLQTLDVMPLKDTVAQQIVLRAMSLVQEHLRGQGYHRRSLFACATRLWPSCHD